MGMTKKQAKQFSDEIRAAVETCGKTRYRIAKETGIDAAVLCRFVQGQVGLVDGYSRQAGGVYRVARSHRKQAQRKKGGK